MNTSPGEALVGQQVSPSLRVNYLRLITGQRGKGQGGAMASASGKVYVVG